MTMIQMEPKTKTTAFVLTAIYILILLLDATIPIVEEQEVVAAQQRRSAVTVEPPTATPITISSQPPTFVKEEDYHSLELPFHEEVEGRCYIPTIRQPTTYILERKPKVPYFSLKKMRRSRVSSLAKVAMATAKMSQQRLD